MGLGEGRKRCLGTRVVDATAGDDDRTLRCCEQSNGRGEFVCVGTGTGNRAHLRREECRRVVVGLCGNILRQSEERGPALPRVEQHRHRMGQGGEHLRRVRDAVPVAHDRTEGIVHRGRRCAEVLDLLEHRVGQA